MKKTPVIIKSGVGGDPRLRLLVVTPTLGIVRMEWVQGRHGQVIPCNWSATSASLGIGHMVPMHYLVADAQNLGCQGLVERDFEWLLLWEDDVIAPADAYLKLNDYMRKAEIPVVSGLYFTKGSYSEPIVYRGLGTSCYTDFKIGDKVWADAVPTGFLLIHSSIIKLMYKESEEYTTLGGTKTKKIFETPAQILFDPITGTYSGATGTSDITWCHRVIDKKVLQRAGWPKIGRRKYPFLCDTNIFCKHIDLMTGKQFPY